VNLTEYSVSPDGKWVAFTQQYNAWVAPFAPTGKTVEIGPETKAYPVRQVSKRSGEFLHWSADSSELHWALGATLFGRKLEDAFSFLDGAPEELPEPVTEGIDLGFRVPADLPGGRIALTGGRVVTMRDAEETREVIENGVVIVNGNRIETVGAAEEIPIPGDAMTIDVAGKTIIPGLVDAHAHGAMGNNEITPEQNWGQFSNLSFGVTTIHDPSNDTTEIFSVAELQRAGTVVGPRIWSTGTILYGAHMPGYTAVIDSYDDAEFHVRRLADVGAISVKSYQQPRRDQRQQVIAAARKLGIMVVPEGGAKLQHNLNEIVDGHTGIEHAVPVAHVYDDIKQLWSQTAVGYTPTFVVAYGGIAGESYWYDRTNVWENERLMRYVPRFLVEPISMRRTAAPDEHYNHVQVAAHAKELRDLGVTVHIGAHGQREGLAAHWEMWMMNQGGFSPWEALRAGTIDGARYIGMDGDIGSIEKGKLADLVVIDGNPLEDLRRSEYVAYTMINGRLFEAATMNQIAPDRVEREEFFFEKPGGDTIHPATQAWIEEWKERHGCRH
jgi:imidazolonepropionase-like amidohydrolase